MNNESCVVHGTLAWVLRCCRALGVSPLRFEKLEKGYKITVSKKYAIYSYILMTFLHANFVCGLTIDLIKRVIKAKPLTNLAFVIPDASTALFTCSFATYYGVYRMKNLIMFLNRLHKAKMNMNAERYQETYKDNVKMALILCYVIPTIIFYLLEVRNLYINYSSTGIISTNYTIFTLVYFAMNILEIQTMLLLLEIQLTLRSVNVELKDMLTRDTFGTTKESRKVNSLSLAYVTACDVLYEINKTDGGYILVVFTNFIITFVTSLYYGTQLFSVLPFIYVFLQKIWCIMYIVRVLAFIESHHYILCEVKYIKINLAKLINKVTTVGRPLKTEMDIMYKQLVINKLTFSPMGMFSLRRSLIITFSGAVITYILFLIQMKF